jgi:hypothetical protein
LKGSDFFFGAEVSADLKKNVDIGQPRIFFYAMGSSQSKFGLDNLAILPWWCGIGSLRNADLAPWTCQLGTVDSVI